MSRVIGIRHRVKRTADGEARPTQLCITSIKSSGKTRRTTLDLEDDTAEMDWMLGRFPVEFRAVMVDDDISKLPKHHLKWRKAKPSDDLDALPPEWVERDGKQMLVLAKIPATYDGLMASDTICMVLGGSGDRFAFALSRRAEELGNGTYVMRIPPFVLNERRKGDKDEDASNLVDLFTEMPHLFRETTARDREQILITELWRARIDAMKERIGCEQRLYQRLTGRVFLSQDGRYPEGSISDAFDAAKASDKILLALTKEESERMAEVAKVLQSIPVYQQVFSPIKGVGPAIAARIIVAIGDIRRFESMAKLKAFLGVHLIDGLFARSRKGHVANWHPDGRQALYLLADQFNRRPESEWGQKLLAYKAIFRAKHPVVVCSTCNLPWSECLKELKDPRAAKGKHARKHSDGHIHKMALWRTVTKFVEWLWKAWWSLEEGKPIPAVPVTPFPEGSTPPTTSENMDMESSMDAVAEAMM